MKLRPAIAHLFIGGKLTDPIPVKFHGWGSEYEEFNEGPPMQYTVAIVEDAAGQVHTVPAHRLRFTDVA